MTGFDIIVLLIVAVAAIGGFARGFVQEVLSLAAWVLAIIAIMYLHEPLHAFLEPRIGTPTTAAILAFALLLLIPYAGIKLIASLTGDKVKDSLLGPLDRVLGFGFGALKGAIVVVLAFALLAIGYDRVWGNEGRPEWITNARTYGAVNAGAEALVTYIRETRNGGAADEADEGTVVDSDTATPRSESQTPSE